MTGLLILNHDRPDIALETGTYTVDYTVVTVFTAL